MNFIKRWFRSQVQNAYDQSNQPSEDTSYQKQFRSHGIGTIGGSGPKLNRSDLDSNGTTFKLYHANGGYVVELRNYDSKHDEHVNSLHIITHAQDLGTELGHIITLEALRK